jgi:glutathione reductase (NADPH)
MTHYDVIVIGSGQTMAADLVVNGAGRVPELEALQLENAAVKSTRRGIDQHLHPGDA